MKTQLNRNVFKFLSLFIVMYAQSTLAEVQSKPENTVNFTSRAVKFVIKDQRGNPVPQVNINAHRVFSVVKPGLLVSGPLLPQIDPHLRESKNEEMIIAVTDESGEANIPLLIWGNPGRGIKYLGFKDMKVSYNALVDSRISGFSPCRIEDKVLESASESEPLIVNCIAYLQ